MERDYMVTVPNQKIIHINKDKPSKDFLQVGLDDMYQASRNLSDAAFRIYMYLCGNADGYELALSQTAIQESMGIKKTAYYTSIKLLEEKGYLEPSYGNRFEFYTKSIFIASDSAKRKIPQNELPIPANGQDSPQNELDFPRNELDFPRNELDFPRNELGSPRNDREIDNIYKHMEQRKIDSFRQTETVSTPESGRTLEQVAKVLKSQGKSDEWIACARSLKRESEWAQYGYGLMQFPSFQQQVDSEMTKREALRAKQEQIAAAFSSALSSSVTVFIPSSRTPSATVELADMKQLEGLADD